LSVLIARWFKAQRGRAMALTGVGMSLGAATMTPVVGLLVEHLGWRSALLAMGAGVGALLVALAFLLRDGPGPDEIETRQAPRVTVSAEPSAAALNFGSILRSPQFWSIGLSCAAAFAVNQTVSITLVPLGQEGGLTTIEAATLMSFLGVGAVAGSLLLALIADRLDRVVLLTTVLLLGAVLNAAVPHAHGYVPLAAISGLIGVTSAALPPTLFALLADRFGPASFGAVRGMTMPLNAVLGMIAVRFAGEAFDRTGGYQLTFETFAILQVAAAALMFASRYLGSASARPAPAPTVS
jgi:predicted MFS family arabinose efflux permease